MAENFKLHDRLVESVGTILTCDSRIGITELDQEIALLYSVITAIKVRRNSLVPVSKIPDELLSQIFVEFASESSTLFNLEWTKLMLVCRRWHTVGINEQLLWSYIELSESHRTFRQAAIQLERSGMSPLMIDLKLGTTGFASIQLMQNIHRVRSLTVTGAGQTIPPLLSRLSRFSMPLLESLTLEAYHLDELPTGVQLHVPDTLLDGRAPRLRSLTLRNMGVTWDLLHSLTDLNLNQDDQQDTLVAQIPTVTELLAMLRRSPGLQKLYIRHFLPSIWLSNDRVVDSVELPKLEELSLAGLKTGCCRLLSCLKVPGTCSFRFLPQGITEGVDARDLLVLIRKQYRSPAALTIRSLEIDSSEYNMHIAGYADTILRDALDSYEHRYIGFNSHPYSERDRRSIMTKLFKALPLDGVTHLIAHRATLFSEKSWKVALEMLPTLETITLRADHPMTLNFGAAILELLHRPLSKNKPSWPRLKHIILSGVYSTLEETDVPERVIQLLLHVLTRYKYVGAQVDVLELTRSAHYVDGSTADALAGVVGKLFMRGYLWRPVEERELRVETMRKVIDAGMDVDRIDPM